MKQHGVEVINLDSNECYEMMQDFINNNRELWNEDIGKQGRAGDKPAQFLKFQQLKSSYAAQQARQGKIILYPDFDS